MAARGKVSAVIMVLATLAACGAPEACSKQHSCIDTSGIVALDQ